MRQIRAHRNLLLALCAASCLATLSSWAQQGAPRRSRVQSDGPLRSITDAEGRRTTILRDNVRLTRDDLRARADSARYYEWRATYHLIGNVVTETDSLDLWTDELFLYERTGSARAIGSVRVESLDGSIGTASRGHYRREDDWLALAGHARVIDEGLVVNADSISIDRRGGLLRAFGSVRIVDEINNAVVTGERGVFDRRAGIAVIDSMPHLVSRRQAGEATEVDSRWMAFDRRLGRSTAIGDVDFRQGLTRATADTVHFLGENLMFLSGEPVVFQEERRISGEFIRILYQARRLREMDVYGGARLVDSSPDSLEENFSGIPLQNTLAGDTLRVFLEHGAVTRTLVVGHASSVYLPEDQRRSISVNEVSGDNIDIGFRERLVHRVDVEGNVEGRYRFLDRTNFFAPDSSAVDSLAVQPDTLVVAEVDSSARVDFAGRADEVIYRGERTEFLVADGRIHIDGTAQVQHGTLTLEAEDIHFDTDERELMAEGSPHLVDRESELVGDRMGYLFEPQTGAVADGATRFDDGFYTGAHIRRVDKKTLLVAEGTYSTCDLAEPHYHFSAKRMKLKVGESVVARQVTLKLSNIPLITLPFYYKNLTKGRRSGILFPSVNLGVSSREGRYIRDVGYYWATNDYTDFQFLVDWNERRDLTTTLINRYNVRYGMRGDVRFDWLRRFTETEKGDEWAFVAKHQQPELFEHWRANASLNYRSSNITRSDLGSNSTTQLLPTQIRSTASLGRRFDNGSSLNLSMDRTQRVNNEDDDPTTDNELVQQTFPSATLSFKTLPLMKPLRPGRSGSPFLQPLRDTTFSQGYSGRWFQTRNETSGVDLWSLSGRFGLNYAPSSIGPLKWSSGASYNDNLEWTHTRQDFVDIPDSVGSDILAFTENADDRRRSLSFRNGVATDIYGFLRTPIGPVRALKHKIRLDASHNFRPAIRDQQLRSQSYSFSMKHEFSLKLRDDTKQIGEDGEIPTRKIDQVLTWDVGTSWDPDDFPDQRWSMISSRVSVRSPVPAIRSLQISQSINPYSWEVESTSINSGLNLRGSIDLGGRISKREEPKNLVIDRLPALADSSAAADSLDSDAADFFDENRDDDPFADRSFQESNDKNALPWSLNSGLGFSRDLQSDGSTRVRATVSMGTTLRLPGEWSLRWNSGFDAERGEFTNQQYVLTRSLHQWKLEFSRGVSGDGSDFGFRLYLSQIPDLEVKRGDRARGGGLNRLSSF